jgi:deoxycytidylate deaminase
MDMPAPDKFLPILEGPELFIALVAPVGANLDLVCEVLAVELSRVRYDVKEIKLSSLLRTFEKYARLPRHPEEKRYHSHMNAGNEMRATFARGDALAILAMSALADVREEISGSAVKPAPRTAYIFRSLKHPDEIETLRNVYGPALYVLSAFSTREDRVRVLAEVFARSHGETRSDRYRPNAEEIILRDEAEVYNRFGQNVRETFPKADFFARADDRKVLENDIQRFIQIVFGHPFQTPNKDEYGMFHARAVALRSADLARQVGAAICSDTGDVLGLGCNDVPKAGGGLYWAGDPSDRRDYVAGYDSSVRFRDEMLRELFNRMKQSGWLESSRSGKNVDELLEEAISEGEPPLLKSTQITSVLEFGRPVHAEMAAIMDTARLGISIRGGIMYCTTFPCHICARHIVAAGIRRVLYIEPYPKSMASRLYPDSITVDGDVEAENSVSFQPFRGIAPRSYARLFEARQRKDERGDALRWKEATAEPRLEQFHPAHVFVESSIISGLRKELEELGLRRVQAGSDEHDTTGVARQADGAR